ncbi:uncharacterized protein LOC126425053 [Schistocerca serialis cubense]|uniref:uncharacterized protein LOC126425053 n=1 Tax=Schistocerca serialis cubense TaxID=2023355 RepID=UPI00214F3AA3|nr:uncharacterized protein LOC126425053 [Schistocerca serialis cubense]
MDGSDGEKPNGSELNSDNSQEAMSEELAMIVDALNAVDRDADNPAQDEGVEMISLEKSSWEANDSDNERQSRRSDTLPLADAGWQCRRGSDDTAGHHTDAATAQAESLQSNLPVRKPKSVAVMVVLSKCSCGSYLKTGTIITSVFCLVLCLVEIATLPYISLTIDTDMNRLKPVILTQIVIGFALSIIRIVCSILLLTGAIQKKAGMLLPWMAVEAVVDVGTAVVGIILCIAHFPHPHTAFIGSIEYAFTVIYVLLGGYVLIVVYSYYQTLRTNSGSVRLLEDSETAEM